MMILAMDAHYREDGSGRAAAIAFRDWQDSEPLGEHIVEFTSAAPYRSGLLYKRELPGLIEVLEKVEGQPDVVVVDGYVWLDHQKRGLGAHLWEALGESVPVIGVAKSEYRGAPAIEVHHGRSWRPLYVSAAGMDQEEAARAVESMHGEHFLPEMLRLVDRLARTRGL